MAKERILLRRNRGCGVFGRIHSDPLMIERSRPGRKAGSYEVPNNSIGVPTLSVFSHKPG